MKPPAIIFGIITSIEQDAVRTVALAARSGWHRNVSPWKGGLLAVSMKLRGNLFHVIALCTVLLVGAYLRFTGLNWGDNQYQHPDERFLVWVVADIAPVQHLGDYFNTAQSTLNPANRGHAFFVYGTLPIFAARYLTDAVFPSVGWAEIVLVGRSLSALSDLLTVFLIYLIAARLFGRGVGLLAGILGAGVVLEIQQAHFFTVDSFAAAFTTLAVYCAVRVALLPFPRRLNDERPLTSPAQWLAQPDRMAFSVFFGIAVGLAMASKLNTAPVAFLLPVALYLNDLRHPTPARDKTLLLLRDLVIGGAAAFFIFRVLQPYAFQGPGFFNILPDSAWLQSIREQRAQAAGDVDFPPALQWARRSHLFSLENMVLWGFGLPLGLLAWGGFLWMGVRFLRELVRRVTRRGWEAALTHPWPASVLVWGWTAVYFLWQSAAWNPTMRYQLPVYPTLVVLAAWAIGALWRARPTRRFTWRGLSLPRFAALLMGVSVVLLTLAWAFAFTRIYNRTETRAAASEWIYDNVPGPVNLHLETTSGPQVRLLSVPDQATLDLNRTYPQPFQVTQVGRLSSLVINGVRLVNGAASPTLNLEARIYDLQAAPVELARGAISLASLGDASLGDASSLEIPFGTPAVLVPGHPYGLQLELQGSGSARLSLNGQARIKMNLPAPQNTELDLPITTALEVAAALYPGGAVQPPLPEHLQPRTRRPPVLGQPVPRRPPGSQYDWPG